LLSPSVFGSSPSFVGDGVVSGPAGRSPFTAGVAAAATDSLRFESPPLRPLAGADCGRPSFWSADAFFDLDPLLDPLCVAALDFLPVEESPREDWTLGESRSSFLIVLARPCGHSMDAPVVLDRFMDSSAACAAEGPAAVAAAGAVVGSGRAD
jgi:hypothetical protein